VKKRRVVFSTIGSLKAPYLLLVAIFKPNSICSLMVKYAEFTFPMFHPLKKDGVILHPLKKDGVILHPLKKDGVILHPLKKDGVILFGLVPR
jgi:hypothetical protein